MDLDLAKQRIAEAEELDEQTRATLLDLLVLVGVLDDKVARQRLRIDDLERAVQELQTDARLKLQNLARKAGA